MTMTNATPRTPAPPASGAVRVMVVDALPLASYGLRALVDQTEGLAWCGATHSMAAALSVVARVRPHAVLVDSRLDQDASGARALLSACPSLRIIGLVHEDRTDYVHAARAAGVHGLLVRSVPPGVLMAAIRTVLGGRPLLDPPLAALLTGAPRRAADRRLLSARQQEILTLIARGLHNSEIAGELFVSVETVRTHVKEILRRLDAQDRAHAVARGYQLGLLGSTKQARTAAPALATAGSR